MCSSAPARVAAGWGSVANNAKQKEKQVLGWQLVRANNVETGTLGLGKEAVGHSLATLFKVQQRNDHGLCRSVALSVSVHSFRSLSSYSFFPAESKPR